MKATVNLFAGVVALGLYLTVPLAWGANPSADDAERRTEAAKALRMADQAMKESNFELASYYIDRAEKLNVKYDDVTAKFENTPEKARQKLAQLKAKPTGAAAPRVAAKPASGITGAPPDPLASRQRENVIESIVEDAKPKAKLYLENGRRSLTQKDLVGATAWYKKAAAERAQFAPGEYSPENLAEELRRQGVDPGGPAAGGNRFAPDDRPPTDEEVRGPAERILSNPPRALAGGGEFGAEGAESGGPRGESPNRGGPANRQPPGGPAARQPSPQQAEAFRLAGQARAALDRGDLDTAKKLAQQAGAMQVAEEAYPKDLLPWSILLEVDAANRRRGGNVRPASYEDEAPAAGPRPKYPVSQSIYDTGKDRSKNMPAGGQDPAPGRLEGPDAGVRLYEAGMRALSERRKEEAQRLFLQAWEYQADLDPRVRQQLQDQMNALRAETVRSPAPKAPSAPSALEAVDAQQRLLQQKLSREIQSEQAAAEKMKGADPRGALERLTKLRDRIRQAPLDPQSQKQLLVFADRAIIDIENFIKTNQGQIELDERNRDVQGDIDRDRLRVIEVQNKLAQLVEDFNKLIEEQRFPEAEVVAKQAKELDNESAVVQTMLWKSRFVRRVQQQHAIRDKSEEGFYNALESADESKIPFDDRNPIVFGDAKRWNELSESRRKLMDKHRNRLTPSEMEIQQSLKTKVRVEFTETPLAVVLDTLGKRAGINIVLDPQGLASEGVTSDTPVTINLKQEISLKSVLDLILQPLHLSHVIQHEVLKVTSEQSRNSNTYAVAYNVADLVIPIPNFVPGYNVGLPAALRDAYNSLGYGSSAPASGSSPSMMLASNESAAAGNASVLAQMGSPGMSGTLKGMRAPHAAGPGGLGGGVQADFDTLIDLITATIAPSSWDDNGGSGSISGFDTNLSLVVSQTQDIHEQIADLLEQLRRLQDLQVTIEVRFISLQDDFFERIGVQFDFSFNDNSNIQLINNQIPDTVSPSATIGLTAPIGATPNPTGNLDIDFRQGGFRSAVPQFGGFDANTAANFGFAILSDIEVFFLLQASMGDTRTNILQAPKVTLFNGQQATISDTSQTPFVTSIIPVVGDFAAAHQPVIIVLSEGTSLSVQAVVSHDKRFVRLTLVPFFSKIGDVKEFTFAGSTTTKTGTAQFDPTNPGTILGRNNVEVTQSGTTVQLPTFAFTTVTTTVSVPDGGTVLLGGVKRLSEGRNERGVPLLSKVPYINRLFKNVGIGRTTRSLMMMVTPRIIIQEEEEERSVGRPLTN